MIGVTFSLEQIAAAPPEVRRWVEAQIGSALKALMRLEHGGAEPSGPQLAACSREEALQVFERLRGDLAATHVFFQLGREPSASAPPFNLFRVGDLLRQAGLASPEQLMACLEAINGAYQQVRRDAAASLFGLDERGLCYVHQGTHDSIAQLWRELLGAQMAAVAGRGEAPAPAFPADPGRPLRPGPGGR
jgi:hypothetical protein